jgi:hypothetical protein
MGWVQILIIELIVMVLFYFWNKWGNPLQKEKKTIVPSWGRDQQPTKTQLIKEAN